MIAKYLVHLYLDSFIIDFPYNALFTIFSRIINHESTFDLIRVFYAYFNCIFKSLFYMLEIFSLLKTFFIKLSSIFIKILMNVASDSI
jgi:hypothetical protein